MNKTIIIKKLENGQFSASSPHVKDKLFIAETEEKAREICATAIDKELSRLASSEFHWSCNSVSPID